MPMVGLYHSEMSTAGLHCSGMYVHGRAALLRDIRGRAALLTDVNGRDALPGMSTAGLSLQPSAVMAYSHVAGTGQAHSGHSHTTLL